MIVLNSTDKIQISLLNSIITSQMACFASYRDTNSTSVTPLRNAASTNNTTQVDLVSSPASSTYRIIDYLSVHNTDTSTNEVTVRLLSSSTPYRLMVVRLAPGEKLEYQEGEGFKVIGNGYSTKTVTTFDGVTDTSNLSMMILKRDYSNVAITANAYVDLPELLLPVVSNKKYWFRYVLFYNTNATTTGSRFNIYGVSAQSFLYYQNINTLTTNSNTLTGGLSAYNAVTASNATSAATSGNVTFIEGELLADYTGTLGVNFASEVVGGTVTVKANSFLQYKQVA